MSSGDLVEGTNVGVELSRIDTGPSTPVNSGIDHIPSRILRTSVAARESEVAPLCNTSGQVTTPQKWTPPSVRVATEYVDANHPRDLEGNPISVCESTTGRHCTEHGCGKFFDPFKEGRNSDLEAFGPGIVNYFKFLKWTIYFFFFWILFSLPSLIVNSWGTGIDTSLDPFSRLAVTTIGNLGDSKNTTVVLFPGCEDERDEPFLYGFDSCQIDKSEVAFVYTFLDVLAIGISVVMYLWLRIFERRTPIILRDNVRTAGDYTVQCVNIPPNTDKERLQAHLEQATEQKVVDVQIAEDCGALFHLCRKRGTLLDEKRRCDKLIQKLHHEENEWNLKHERDWPFQYKLQKAKLKSASIMEKLELNDERNYIPRGEEALTAFVTFDKEIGARKALAYFPSKYQIFSYLFQAKNKKFEVTPGNFVRLSLRPAPQPSTILWQNLQYGNLERRKIRLFTTSISFSLLFVSLIVALLAKYYEDQTYDLSGKNDYAVNCDSSQGMTEEAALYCRCQELPLNDRATDPECADFFAAEAIASALTLISAGTVVGVSTTIGYIVRWMTRNVEKHHSIESQEISVYNRMVFLLMLNLGVVTMLANASWFLRNLSFLGVEVDEQADFGTFWFATTGSKIIFTMILNIFGPHMFPIMGYVQKRCKASWWRCTGAESSKFVTQEDLNKWFLGPEFTLSYRYAQAMATICVCLMFGGGMPILYSVGFVSMLLFYWTDKFLFVRHCRTPPRFNIRLGQKASYFIYFALLLHTTFTLWMFGNEEIFVAEEYQTENSLTQEGIDLLSDYETFGIRARLLQRHTILLFITLLVLILFGIFRHLYGDFTGCASYCFNCILCGDLKNLRQQLGDEDDGSGNQISFYDARRNKTLKGLHSYNILKNPEYVRAIHVSESFANRHTHFHSAAQLEDAANRDRNIDEV